MARRLAVLVLLAAFGAGCRQDMHNQPKYKPFRESELFPDGRSMRPLVKGTVARGTLHDGDPLYTGVVDDDFVSEIPVPVTAALLERGQGEFQVFCSPCHGRTGWGDGVIVQRGFQKPASFHIDRLRQMPIGYFFDVMTNGFGAMADYSAQVRVEDRWAIAAYVRTLQLSQHASPEDVPGEHQAELDASLEPAEEPSPVAEGEGH